MRRERGVVKERWHVTDSASIIDFGTSQVFTYRTNLSS